MVNQSKTNDQRFWKKWRNAGAIGSMSSAYPRSPEGEISHPDTFPYFSVDRGAPADPSESRYFLDERTAAAYFAKDVDSKGHHVQLLKWDRPTSGYALVGRPGEAEMDILAEGRILRVRRVEKKPEIAVTEYGLESSPIEI